MKRNKLNVLGFFLVVFISTVSFFGCGTANKSADESMMNTEASKEAKVESRREDTGFSKSEAKSNDSNLNPKEQKASNKIIVYETIDIETLQFEEDKNAILNRVDYYGGYIESSNITGKRINDSSSRRKANLVARIPKDKLKDFKTDIKEFGNIINTSINSQDITMEYFDTEAHVEALKIQEERLLDLLKKSGELKDILEVEKELQRVRYEIERLTGSLKKWDNLVEYATVTINVFEVKKYKEVIEEPETWGQRIASAFNNSIKYLVNFFKGLVVALVSAIPFIPFIAVVVFAVYKIIKKIKNRK